MTQYEQYETGWDYDNSNRTWRAPPPPYSGPHEHQLIDLRPGTIGPNVLVPAANVQAGTFGAGNFTYTGNVDITGRLKMGDTTGSVETPWMEMRSLGSNPGIDFTRTPGTVDFNVRLINDTNGSLRFVMGVADGGFGGIILDSGWFRIVGNQGIYWQTHGGGWHMTDTTWIRAYQGKGIHTTGNLDIVGTGTFGGNLVANDVKAVHAQLGGWSGDHGQFCHRNRRNAANNMGFIQRWDGYCWIAGPEMYFDSGGVRVMSVLSGGIHLPGKYVHSTTEIRADSKFTAGWEYGSSGVYLCNNADTAFRVYGNAGVNGVTLAGWITAQLDSVGYDVMVEAGRGGASNRNVNRGSNAWRDSGAATHWNHSDPSSKRAMRPLRETNPGQLAKVKAIKPIKFKWNDYPDEPEKEFFGFNADELPSEVTRTMPLWDEDPEFPEDTSKRKRRESKMMSPTGMIAVLWAAVQELTERVDAMTPAPPR